MPRGVHELDLISDRARFRSDEQALQAWNDGVSLVERGELVTAVAFFKRLAEQRYEGAAEVLARIYECGGQGLKVDLVEARAWYEASWRDEGGREACLGLARVLLQSEAQSDHTRALGLLEAATLRGDVRASLTLATVLEAGYRVPKDVERAKKLYESASSLGYVYATNRLAQLASERGETLNALRLRLKAGFEAMKIAGGNPRDERLWQVLEV